MKVFAGKKGKKGFTLLEVVLVVAILSIAMAITVPGVVRTSRNLKITELDDIAKEIYTSVQSRSVSLSVSGQLSQVGGNPRVVTLADGGSTETTTINAISNYERSPGAATPNYSGQIDMLLPLGSIDETVRQNYYLIEFNPVTAAVKGVYYWEDADNKFPETHYDDTADSREERMKYAGGMVGYYGGEDVKRLPPPTEGDSSVKAELINDEELYLKITPGQNTSRTLLKGTITITLTDLDQNVSKQIASFANDSISNVNDRLTYESGFFKLTLDSLKDGLRFSKLDDVFPMIHEEGDDASFHPGCNLKVTVTFQEEEKQAKDAVFLTNSLYASVDGKYGEDRTAYIACGRHLENLGVRFVYPGAAPGVESDPLNGVTRAVQTKNIDWTKSVAKVGGDPTLFTPIVNHKGLTNSQYLKEYDGKGNTISHLNISADIGGITDGIGLFDQFVGESIENVNLVNCTLTGSGSDSQPVGLLAGSVAPAAGTCEIFNCRAYAEKEKDDAGGESPITSGSCSINAPGAASAGGLFGSVQKANVKRCSASLTTLAGGANVGGLAGQVADDVTINSCYADTGLRSSAGNTWESGLSGGTVGGLVGSAGDSLTLKNSYAVGWISNSSTRAYGLVGSGSGGTIETCYAAVTHGDRIASLVPSAPSALAAAANDGGCINYGGAYAGFDSLLTNPGNPFTKGGSAPEQRAKTTHAYGMPAPAAGSFLYYPFPRLSAMPHYGDWPQEEAAMVYYEVYQNGGAYSIGFYNKDVPALQSLEDGEDYAVVMDGYGVMLPTADASAAAPTVEYVSYNGHPIDGTSDLKPLNASEKFNGMDITNIDTNGNITGTAYHPLFLSNAMMTEESNVAAKKDSYYQKLEVKAGGLEVNVWFNPYVAKSDFKETDPGTAVPGTSILRSARQVTAYSYDAMQETAAGNGETTHTLQLERDISLAENEKKFKTDTGEMACVDLKISHVSAAPNVILELNGKTLTGTGAASVVTSEGGKLEIYGHTKAKPHDEPRGTIKGGGSGDSVSAAGEITVVGCTIIPG